MALGRPRKFDREMALDRAMRLFWAHGYVATSLEDLAIGLGMNRPSIYSAFQSKEALFLEALARYDATEGAALAKVLDQATTARDGIQDYLRANAKAYVRPDQPRGCMSVTDSPLGSSGSAKVSQALSDSRQAGYRLVLKRLRRGISEGDVPASADINRAARYITALTQGLSVQARDGAGQSDLETIVDAAMAGWQDLVGARQA